MDDERDEANKKSRAGGGKNAKSILLQEFWNLPNMLTVARMAVIPLFVWLTYEADPLSSFIAAVVLALASITDVIDGYLARKWNLVTVVGKFMDPLADKLIVMAAFVMMVRLGRVAAWVVIVLLAREFIISGLRMVAASEGMVIAAGQEGKWKTSFQLTGLISLCIHYTHPLNLIWATYPVDYNQVGKILIYVSMVFSIWSAAVYFRAFLATLATRGVGGAAAGPTAGGSAGPAGTPPGPSGPQGGRAVTSA